MKSTLFLLSLLTYFVGLATLLNFFLVMGSFNALHSPIADLTPSLPARVMIDGLLVGLFCLQHSGMARLTFKQTIRRFIPEGGEGSLFVLASSAVLNLMIFAWQPIGGIVWQVTESPWRGIIFGGYFFGCLLVALAVWQTNHFQLFGVRQAYRYFKGLPQDRLEIVTSGMYAYIRHPLYLGMFFTFWLTPEMSHDRLILAILLTSYILLAIAYEERDLMAIYGKAYASYRARVPAFFPVRQLAEAKQADSINTDIQLEDRVITTPRNRKANS